MTNPQEHAAGLRLLALDVDGVLTDGRIYYGNDGEELKTFSIRDGLGLKLLQQAGLKVAIITGRKSNIVDRRAAELGIGDVIQGREDKLQALQELCRTYDFSLAECAYMGDDLPDLGAIHAAGLGLSVADGDACVRSAADWVSSRNGGCGAVREACEYILELRGELAGLQAEFD